MGKNVFGRAMVPLLLFSAFSLAALPANAAIGGRTIGGCIYTGDGTATYTPTGPANTPVANWDTKYAQDGAVPIIDAVVMIQNQHHGGQHVAYPKPGVDVDGNAIDANCWEYTMPDSDGDGNPDVTDLITTFAAPGHEVTSREWTWDPDGRFSQVNWGVLPDLSGGPKWPGGPTQGHFIHPTGKDSRAGGQLDGDGNPMSVWATGAQDAYLMTYPQKTTSALHYVFYDNFTDGNDNGPQQDPPLNGVTVRVFNEHGNVVATGITGQQGLLPTDPNCIDPTVCQGGIITDDGVVYSGALAYGLVYFQGLPGNDEYKIESDPSTATQALNTHFTMSMGDVANAQCTEGAQNHYNYELPGCKWYQTYTEEGTHAGEIYAWPGSPGTMDGGYLTWHGMVEKLPSSVSPPAPGLPPNPSHGIVSGHVIDSTGADPLEAPTVAHGGRLPPTNARFENGVAWNRTRSAGNWGGVADPLAPASDVIPNTFVKDGRVVLYSLDGPSPKVVATAITTPVDDVNDPTNGGYFEFTDVPPGNYGLYAMDRNLNYVSFVGAQVTVTPGSNTAVPMLYERWGARTMGFVERNGAPEPGIEIKKWYKAGTTKHATTTNENGWFLDPMWWETGQMGVQYANPTDNATWRGKIVTEQFVDLPTIIENHAPWYNWVTHNSMSRSVGYATHNYFVDLQIEDIPAGVGNLIGATFNDHFSSSKGQRGDGVYGDDEDRLWQGWDVELYEAPALPDTCSTAQGPLVGTRRSGKFSKADARKMGWNAPYSYPADEIGSMHASPVLFFPGGGAGVTPVGALAPAPADFVQRGNYPNIGTSASETARFNADTTLGPMPGFYEFRDLAPGNYCVRVMPKPGFRRSPDENIEPGGFKAVTVNAGQSRRVDLGANTTPTTSGVCEITPPATAGTCSNNATWGCSADADCQNIGHGFGVKMAGEVEGGMWDGMQAVDSNPTSLLFMDAIAMFGSPVEVKDGNDYFVGVGFQGDTRCHAYNNSIHPPGTSMLDPTDPNYDSFACRSTINLSAKPELERRFVAGANRYIGNATGHLWNRWDPSVPAWWGGQSLPPARGISHIHNPAYDSMELGIGVSQAAYKFEAAWTPLTSTTGAGNTFPMCVNSLVGDGYLNAASWTAVATVTVSDGWSPVQGAEVFGTWSSGGGNSCVTDGSGMCSVVLEQANQGDADVTFFVNTVVPDQLAPWYQYDSNPAPFDPTHPLNGACLTSLVINSPTNPGGPTPPPAPQCSDGVDNDGDGLVDDLDDGCLDANGVYDPLDNNEFLPPQPPPAVYACSDGLDNDGDGLIDFGPGPTNDPGCASIFDMDETDPPPTTGTSHVVSMNGIPTFGEKLFADVTVIIEDNANARVGSAVVDFSYTWLKEGVPSTNNGTCTTAANGICTMTTAGMDKATSVTVTLTNVVVPGLAYSVAENTVPVTIMVPNNTNNPPAPTALPIVTDVTVPGTTQVNHGDPVVGETFTYSITTPPANGVATISPTGLVTYTSSVAGTDSLMATVTDGWGASRSVNIPVTVHSANLPPVPTATDIVTVIGVPGTSQVDHGDPNAEDTHTYAIVNGPFMPGATAAVSPTGLVTYTPAPFPSADSLTVVVTDDRGMSGTVTLNVTVNQPVNNAPNPTAPAIVTDVGVPGTSQVLHGDPDAGDTQNYFISTAPANGTANVTPTGLVIYAGNTPGQDSLVVTVFDSQGASGTVTIDVTVNQPANTPPAPTAPAIVTDAGVPGTSQVLHGDPDAGDTHMYVLTGAPANGFASVNPQTGLVTYTGFAAGQDSLTVTVYDAQFATGTVTISVTVNAGGGNNPPAPTASAIVTAPFVQGTSQVVHGDPDAGDTHFYVITGPPANGFASVGPTGFVSYTGFFPGTDSITVTVYDSQFASGTVTIPVTVQ